MAAGIDQAWTASVFGDAAEYHPNGKNYGGEKELIAYLEGCTADGGNPLTVRWYMGRSRRASVVYCTVWYSSVGGVYLSGSGRAGGFGYCKKSAAFDAALGAAGLDVRDEDGNPASIHGVGSYAIRKAARALVYLATGGDGFVIGSGY